MRVTELELPGVKLLEPDLHRDDRGWFRETWRRDRYAELGVAEDFVQDNHSRSRQGVLRGLHFQRRHPQGKLLTVLRGRIYDVVAEIRPQSPCHRRWVAVELDDETGAQLYVPPGYAHGFVVLSEQADVAYRCSAYYVPGDDGGVIWNDPDLAIDWPVSDPLLSAKDAELPPLAKLTENSLPQWPG
ncbi:MAG: dTDP-4-dehydrorhamnose 3,5-epimerase [Gammaproteobacteria bacterium]|jgi:dTDP-4-dehydrorhamnose 3,5-epimerase